MRKILWLVLGILLGMEVHSQRSIISNSSVDNRSRIISKMPREREKVEAERFAEQFGLPVRESDSFGRIKEIRRIEGGRHPIYYSTDNLSAAKTVSTQKVWSGSFDGMNLRGKNILVGVWDGGKIRTTHVEFGTRVYSLDSGFEIVGHATHVAGTIGAAGLDPDATGMANQCYIEGYDWDNDNGEMRQAAKDGLLLSNHSYGFVHGFDYNAEEGRWEWFGDIDINEEEDYKFGFYGIDSRIWDNIAYDHPHYLILKSAGNDRLDGPGAGAEHFVLDNGWKASNKVRDKDGGPDGFDCIGSQGTSKNILTVGAVEDIEDGYSTPENVKMTNFSTFGPTDDGRIKPDIVGNGANVYSTYFNNDTDYNTLDGTSMATPNVAGSLALLQELYFKKHNKFMRSSTLKGLVLHSADDAGNDGPDYKFGWGLLNTFSAAKLINSDSKVLLEDSIANQTSCIYRVYAASDSAIKMTICWTDPAGPVVEPEIDPRDTILVNDLDIRLIKLKDSTVYEPFILNPELPNAPAQTGDNFRDNIEQIYLPLSEKGYYDLIVTHKRSIANTIQHFSLLTEGVNQVFVAEDSTYLDDNNGFLLVTDAPEYPLDQRFVWLIEPQNELPVSIHFIEFNTETSDIVTIYDGPNAASPVLGQFSGVLTDPDTLLKSSTGSMFIEFTSGTSSGFKGFSSKYCTESPDENILIHGTNNPCNNSEEIYTFPQHPETDYLWSYSGITEDSVSENQNLIVILVPETQFELGVTPSNKCGAGNTSYRTIDPLNSPPDINQLITGDRIPCTNVQSLFRVEENPTTVYRWQIPEGWGGRSDSSSILITPLKVEGTISVLPGNSCGEAGKINLTVNPISLPRIPVIQSDRISPCENSITEFRILAQEEIDYVWDVENGWDIIGTDTLERVSVNIGTGTAGRMYLTSSNKCGDTLTSRNFLLSPSPDSPDLVLRSSSIDGLEEVVIRNYSDYAQVNWFRNDSLFADFGDENLILQRNGVYRVDGANSEGCWASTEAMDHIQINKESLLYNISTGSEGLIKIENDSQESAVIKVYDLTGRIVYSNEIQLGTNLFQTERRGLLIFRLEGNENLKTQMVFVH